jgi:hypothetical protein
MLRVNTRNTYGSLVGKSHGKWRLWVPSTKEDNINTNLRKTSREEAKCAETTKDRVSARVAGVESATKELLLEKGHSAVVISGFTRTCLICVLLLLSVNRSQAGVWHRMCFCSADQREFRGSGLIYTLRVANRETLPVRRKTTADPTQSSFILERKLALFRGTSQNFVIYGSVKQQWIFGKPIVCLFTLYSIHNIYILNYY